MKLYRSYMFRTKDPVIDELRTLVEDHFGGRVRSKHLSDIEKDGGPSTTAMHGWFFGKTKKPQSATVEAAGRALGYKRKWVRMNGRVR
jgi:hypothetical protein